MSDTNRPPLWLLMEAAYHKRRDPGLSERHDYAREIRAVRDYIRHHVPGNGWHTWQIRQLMDLLNAEADRAEQGDG